MPGSSVPEASVPESSVPEASVPKRIAKPGKRKQPVTEASSKKRRNNAPKKKQKGARTGKCSRLVECYVKVECCHTKDKVFCFS